MNTPRFLSMLSLLAAAATSANGQGLEAERTVTGAGGGISGNGSIVLRVTAGQSAIGDIGGPRMLMQQGFWLHAAKTAASANSRENPATGSSLAMYAQPNPFSESTDLVVNIPATGHVTARLHDVHGNVVRTLVDGVRRAGALTIPVDGSQLPSGNYVVILTAGERRATATLRLVK